MFGLWWNRLTGSRRNEPVLPRYGPTCPIEEDQFASDQELWEAPYSWSPIWCDIMIRTVEALQAWANECVRRDELQTERSTNELNQYERSGFQSTSTRGISYDVIRWNGRVDLLVSWFSVSQRSVNISRRYGMNSYTGHIDFIQGGWYRWAVGD